MVGPMMWFKREPKQEKENGIGGKFKRKKAVLLKPTRESSERETSTESEKEKRRYSDILDIKVSQDRRDDSDESLYESADCHSDAISASDDALPRLSKTPTISKESLKLAVTDEEFDLAKTKKGHRKTMSLSNPLEMVKNLGDEWFDSAKKELEKHSDKKKSRESLWSEEDRDSIHGSTMKLDQIRKNSKKDDKIQSNCRKSSTVDPPKSRKTSKGSSVSALNFLRRKKTPTSSMKAEDVAEAVDKVISTEELLNYTRQFLEEEKRYSAVRESRPIIESDTDEEPAPKPLGEHRRRLSRQTSRSKSKVRGKSQSVKVNTLRKSHSGTLKKGKKKTVKTPLAGRSRQTSVVEQTPVLRKKTRESFKHSSWLFSGSRGESRREGSTDETAAPETDVDANDVAAKEQPDKDNNWRAPAPSRGVNRAESCRERDAPRRGKHRNASDPNRLTAHNNHDLEPGSVTAPSGSSSSSSLSSRSNESNTVAAEHHASQSDLSEDDDVTLPQQWADSLPPRVLETLVLSARRRKRQEVIHELITSEGSHVKWLRALARAFLRPLEASPGLLPPDELRALFPNLPGVRERHNRLYADLLSARNAAEDHVVQLGPIADALLNTLGDSGYAACLSRFCRGQRMALDALKERRRKHKELHQFLATREQLPLCGRLQLRDLLACVWQRLTKYQLLLEGILKTVDMDDECGQDPEAEVIRLRRALDVAKEVLHSVDMAIRTAENEHRLRYIQSKLEVRVPTTGTEWDEPRRLDLLAPMRSLRLEAELSVRIDTNKKMPVLALMMEDCLVLLQREGDKFLLKPITQPSQQLSPLIKWDKVLFRPNAAVRNTFFLMNINGVQMHELSTNTAQEYSNWVKQIQQLPLVKPELKPSLTPSHQASRSTDDSGINVSRNPSDASEKSTSSTAPDDESERDRASAERVAGERDRTSAERTDERERQEKRSVEREERRSEDKEEASEREHKARRPTVGRISTHGTEPPPALVDAAAALTVHEPAAVCAATAERVYTHQERLKRLDEGIARALRAKSVVVSELLGIPAGSFADVAELAVAETLGQVDICSELRSTQSLSRSNSVEEQMPPCAPDMHQLLLAAQAQANQLTETLAKALTVNEASHVASRVPRRDRCDSCRSSTGAGSGGSAGRRRTLLRSETLCTTKEGDEGITEDEDLASATVEEPEHKLNASELDKDGSYDMLVELGADDALETDSSAAALATRLVGGVCGLQATLGRLLAALPALQAERRALRQQLCLMRDMSDARSHRHTEDTMTEEFPKYGLDLSIQDQPSNGG